MQQSETTFVLVHGAWHGGWCWRRVADRLRAAGHTVFSPTLTGLGERSHLAGGAVDLSTHIADVVNVLAWERLENVVLAGHSYGGFVVSGVAEAMERAVASLVFVDAFVPENGDTLLALMSPGTRERLAGAIAGDERMLAAPPAAFFHVNENDRAWVDSLCGPQPAATFTQPIVLTGARERVAKKTYTRAGGYPSASFDAALAKVRARPDWLTHELPCGHDIMLDMPERLTEILLESA